MPYRSLLLRNYDCEYRYANTNKESVLKNKYAQ